MAIKVQYNPSTGKVSYNPATGKVLNIDTNYGMPCGLCDNPMPILRWTTADVTRCCAAGSGTNSRELIGSWDNYLNTSLILTNFIDSPSGCVAWEDVIIPSDTLYMRRHTDSVVCSGSYFDTEVGIIRYYWSITSALVLGQIQIQTSGGSLLVFGGQWTEDVVGTPPFECLGDEGDNLTRFDDCTDGPSSTPTTGGTCVVEAAF